MKPEENPKPKFFLEKELILFLQENMKLDIQPKYYPDNKIEISASISICNQTIVISDPAVIHLFNHSSEITNLSDELYEVKADLKSTIHHMLDQKRQIDELKQIIGTNTTTTNGI